MAGVGACLFGVCCGYGRFFKLGVDVGWWFGILGYIWTGDTFGVMRWVGDLPLLVWLFTTVSIRVTFSSLSILSVFISRRSSSMYLSSSGFMHSLWMGVGGRVKVVRMGSLLGALLSGFREVG